MNQWITRRWQEYSEDKVNYIDKKERVLQQWVKKPVKSQPAGLPEEWEWQDVPEVSEELEEVV